ncbi:helix-turn-helix domain-containing protein [candidate division KSB1 bacterium]|nr:helix-turn-helix domain-containing protein [candidate division KSB1 bacterium]
MQKLGTIIREAREKKELSIQDVHESTRIAIDRIEMVEKGEWDELPLTYYRSFVHSLSEELGLDSKKLLDEWESREYDEPVVILDEDLRLVSAKNYRSILKINQPAVFILVIVLGIIAVALLGIKISSRYFVDPSDTAADSIAVQSDTLMTEDSVLDPFVIAIKTQKDIQLIVQLDRNPSMPVQVKKERVSQWSVQQSLQIVLEKSESLEIMMDGKPLQFEIQKGLARPHLMITRDGVEVKSKN